MKKLARLSLRNPNACQNKYVPIKETLCESGRCIDALKKRREGGFLRRAGGFLRRGGGLLRRFVQ